MDSHDAAIRLGLWGFAGACGEESLPAEVTAEEALQRYAALSPEARKNYGETLGRKLAAEDPAKGAAALAALPREERQAAASGFAKEWAARDAAASWQWITEHLDTGRTEAATGWAHTAPVEEAARVMSSAEPSALTDSSLQILAKRMSREDPARAAAWARSLPDPTSRSTAWRETAMPWVESAPEEAIPALTAPDAPPLTNNLYHQIASALAKKDPELARDYIRRLPPERAVFAEKGLPENPAE